MRIRIDLGRDSGKDCPRLFRHMRLSVPNSFIKSRLAVGIIRRGINSKKKEGQKMLISADFITQDFLKSVYGCLKTVVKEQGHFNLAEVEAADGTKVIVRF